ncbi:facilitated trehalose transporter Tret1-like [Schistocerca serialis cubense]|uniref:facilitated trehalose transporter Tret1-like n=1 Tax=Schistocerca serialis cubense TaxID=2023355 RepID=UPI00214EB3BB|nr:facilitated trehalose transporter Tret1-like [Schistocerca serialis cubense]
MVASGVTKQYAAALAGNLAAMMSGMVMSWSSPALGKLGLWSSEEESWAGSLAALGAAFGPWVGGWGADRLGRRGVLLWSAVPATLGWAMLMAAEHPDLPHDGKIGLLYAARLISGAAVGAVYVALPMYIGEMSQPSIRGALGTLMQLIISLGMMVMYGAGPYISTLALGGISLVVPLLFAAAFFWMPETPYQFLQKDDVAGADKALQWFRDEGADTSGELKVMQEAAEELRRNKASMGDLFKVRGNVLALCLSLGLVLFQQLSGINAVLFYGQDIFQQANTGLGAEVSQIVVGAVMIVASCITPLAADRLGRKPLLLISAVGMAIADVALGTYFYVLEYQDASSLGWLPVTSLVVYIFVYSPGFGALPWAVMGEIFPTNVKALASSLTASFCWLVAFLITKFFSQISSSLGAYTPFWFFSVCCIAAALFVVFLLPETKGRRLEEIQAILNKR